MGNGGIQLRIGDLLFAVQKRWVIIVTLTFLGGVFGLLLTGMSYVQSSLASYKVSGSVVVNTLSPDGKYLYGDDAPSQNDFHLAEDMVDSVIYTMRSTRVLEEVINRQELLGISCEDIQNGMSISVYNSTQILEFTINWTNDEEGKRIWQAVIEITNEVMPETLMIGHLAVLNECTATLVGMGGSGRSMPIVLAVLGFAAGVGFAIMELLMRPTLTNVKDIESVFGLEIIGQIPRDNAYFQKKSSMLVENDEVSSDVTQNYSAAAYILRNRLGTKENHHCFYVTSAANREGRSTVAANLAIQLSDMEHRTLLVDFDTRNPSLGALFLKNVDYARSLNALYRGEATQAEAITTLTGYLDILPAVLEHNHVPMDSTVIELVQKLCQEYEYVILDAPPVGIESETLSLNQLADTVLFVVSYDGASIPEIQNALDKLDKSGIRVLGCIVNNVQGSRYKGQDNNKNTKKQIQEAQKKKKTGNEEPNPEQQETSDLPIVKSKTKKKKKKGGKDAPDESAPEVQSATNIHSPRNVIDELMDEAPSSKSMDDQEMLEELYKLGIQGDEKETPKEAAGEPGDEAKEDTTVDEAKKDVTVNEAGKAPEAKAAEETSEAESQEAPEEPAKEPEIEAAENVTADEAEEALEAETGEEPSEPEPDEAPEDNDEEPEAADMNNVSEAAPAPGLPDESVRESEKEDSGKSSTQRSRAHRTEDDGDAEDVQVVSTNDVWSSIGWRVKQ